MTVSLLFPVLLFGITSSVFGFRPIKTKDAGPKSSGCPDIPTHENFNITKFTGTWHEHIKLIPLKSYKHSGLQFKCPSVEIDLFPNSTNNGNIRIDMRQRKTGHSAVVRGGVLVPDTNEPAKLLLRLSPGSVYSNYWILATDYVRYALVYSCSPNPLFPANFVENISVMTRKRGKLLASIHYSIEKLLFAYFKKRKLYKMKSDQENCGSVKISKKPFFSDIVLNNFSH